MPAAEAAPVIHTGSPYPGLRSFEAHESFLFHGRETHTQQLLDRLAHHRFLAVVGTSGSGKSSLVRAGLLPALYRGFLSGAGSRWRIAVMRPGNAPLENLAEALAKPDALKTYAESLRKTIELSSFGLLEAVRQARLEPGESLLVVVDQFEELFRFHRDGREGDGGAEAQLFVASLLEAAAAFSPAVYVVLTMRSDFLGDCAQFPGLPEALNQSQYLIPRLTREQRREAIEKPLALVGARMTPSLVQRLLYELGDDPDQLPVLQHALNRTWQKWRDDGAQGEIEYRHYQSAGTLQGALRDHAEALMDGLSADAVGKVFRCLTTLFDGRKIRRPATLDRVMAVAGEANAEAARAVVERYAAPANSLLVLSPPGKLERGTMIDIAHESLIRRWTRLDQWVDDEADCVRWYGDAVEDTRRLRSARVKTWRDPKLAYAQGLLAGVWNESWAEWALKDCPVPFQEVKAFLRQGAHEQAVEEHRQETERQAKLEAERKAKEAALAAADAQRKLAELERAAAEQARSREQAERNAKNHALALAEAERVAKETAISREAAEMRAKEMALAAAQSERQAKDMAIAREAAEQEAKEAALATAEAERGRAEAEREAKEMALAREAAERSRKKWLGVGFAAALLFAVAAAAGFLYYRRATQMQQELSQALDEEAKAQDSIRSLSAQLDYYADQRAKSTSPAEAAKLTQQAREAETKRFAAEADLRAARVRIQEIAQHTPTGSASFPSKGDPVPGDPAGRKRTMSDGLTYVWIAPGSFTMGCSPGDQNCDNDEKPEHSVQLTSGFWMGQTEVTQAAWTKVMGTDPSHFKGADLPVESVSWEDANRYCQAISGRLPTEAEWEYAARAGATAPDDLKSFAWFDANSDRKTHPVAKLNPNQWGLYDMLGNVWEWVGDWYGPYGGGLVKDPRGPAVGERRVLRGGSWDDLPVYVRVSYRNGSGPTYRFGSIGFRCAGELR
ncbi:MAG: SUMF1/EgtB/PvdO family nonheme iron enzyme [Bryobacteraceae bacterium]